MCNSGFDFDFVPDVEERESDESECCARIEVRGSSQLNRIRHFLKNYQYICWDVVARMIDSSTGVRIHRLNARASVDRTVTRYRPIWAVD